MWREVDNFLRINGVLSNVDDFSGILNPVIFAIPAGLNACFNC
ncbi:hypothetical protein [Zhongshania sp.]